MPVFVQHNRTKASVHVQTLGLVTCYPSRYYAIGARRCATGQAKGRDGKHADLTKVWPFVWQDPFRPAPRQAAALRGLGCPIHIDRDRRPTRDAWRKFQRNNVLLHSPKTPFTASFNAIFRADFDK